MPHGAFVCQAPASAAQQRGAMSGAAGAHGSSGKRRRSRPDANSGTACMFCGARHTPPGEVVCQACLCKAQLNGCAARQGVAYELRDLADEVSRGMAPHNQTVKCMFHTRCGAMALPEMPVCAVWFVLWFVLCIREWIF